MPKSVDYRRIIPTGRSDENNKRNDDQDLLLKGAEQGVRTNAGNNAIPSQIYDYSSDEDELNNRTIVGRFKGDIDDKDIILRSKINGNKL